MDSMYGVLKMWLNGGRGVCGSGRLGWLEVGNLSGWELFWMSGGRRSEVKGWGIEWKVLLYEATDLLEGGLVWFQNDRVVEW